MDFAPAEGEEAGLLLTQNERFSFLLVKERHQGRDDIVCWQIINGVRTELARTPAPAGRVYLFIEGEEGGYSFYWGSAEREMNPLLLHADGVHLSSLVADGYVGAFIGMYASSGRAAEPDDASFADFDWFRYEMIEE